MKNSNAGAHQAASAACSPVSSRLDTLVQANSRTNDYVMPFAISSRRRCAASNSLESVLLCWRGAGAGKGQPIVFATRPLV
jgi:hypothetical protein